MSPAVSSVSDAPSLDTQRQQDIQSRLATSVSDDSDDEDPDGETVTTVSADDPTDVKRARRYICLELLCYYLSIHESILSIFCLVVNAVLTSVLVNIHRMLSNRESARRSRRRKQEHMSDLVSQVSCITIDAHCMRSSNPRIYTNVLPFFYFCRLVNYAMSIQLCLSVLVT